MHRVTDFQRGEERRNLRIEPRKRPMVASIVAHLERLEVRPRACLSVAGM